MWRTMMKSKLYSDLVKQIENATGPVQAVVQIRHADSNHSIPPADEVGPLVKTVFDRVEKICGQAAMRTNILQNVASAIVEANPCFLRVLIAQPEVISAIPNEISQSLVIPPIDKRPA